MTKVFGRWDWDAEAPGLVNRVTGERVIYRGPADEPDLLLGPTFSVVIRAPDEPAYG